MISKFKNNQESVISKLKYEILYVKFNKKWPNDFGANCFEKQTDRQIDTQTYLIPGINIFSHKMTEYKNNNKTLRIV